MASSFKKPKQRNSYLWTYFKKITNFWLRRFNEPFLVRGLARLSWIKTKTQTVFFCLVFSFYLFITRVQYSLRSQSNRMERNFGLTQSISIHGSSLFELIERNRTRKKKYWQSNAIERSVAKHTGKLCRRFSLISELHRTHGSPWLNTISRFPNSQKFCCSIAIN